MEKIYGNLRKPARARRARAMHWFCRSQKYSNMFECTIVGHHDGMSSNFETKFGIRGHVALDHRLLARADTKFSNLLARLLIKRDWYIQYCGTIYRSTIAGSVDPPFIQKMWINWYKVRTFKENKKSSQKLIHRCTNSPKVPGRLLKLCTRSVRDNYMP